MTSPFQARVPRDLVVVDGPDATSFLQSLLSQDLDPVEVGSSTSALLLQPQGKLLVVLRATRVEADRWSCDCEAGFGAVLADGLNRFRIRVKVEIGDVPGVAMLAARGLDVPPGLADALPAPGGFDVVGPPAHLDEVAAQIPAPVAGIETYERWRIEAGVPRLGADVDDRTIPQEAGLEHEAVSFTKGCFVGQELVCRIDTRGHVNRVLRRIRADAVIEPGAEVRWAGKSVGMVTSTAGTVALAMLRREVEPAEAVLAGSVPATVEAL